MRLAHLGVLGLYAQILVAATHYLAIDTKALAPWASYVAAITGICEWTMTRVSSAIASDRMRCWPHTHC